jgi:hypothetical protein
MSDPSVRMNLVRKDNKMNRYKVVDTLNLKEVEQEIDALISIAGDEPTFKTMEEVSALVRVAKSLGSVRSW